MSYLFYQYCNKWHFKLLLVSFAVILTIALVNSRNQSKAPLGNKISNVDEVRNESEDHLNIRELRSEQADVEAHDESNDLKDSSGQMADNKEPADDVDGESLEKKVFIVGAGLSGGVIGERIASTCKNFHVTIIDQRDHIGGNCYDYVDEETLVRVHKYGAHIFHTSDDGVFKYLSRFTKWTKYEHRVMTKLKTGQIVEVGGQYHCEPRITVVT
jgi:hypothetical protein